MHPTINPAGYLYYGLTSDNNPTGKRNNEYAHRLFGMIFNYNDDIFNNTDFDPVDRYRWCNKPENTRWVTSKENMNNRGVSTAKIDRTHDESDIEYLEDWTDHFKIQINKMKDKKEKMKRQNKRKLKI